MGLGFHRTIIWDAAASSSTTRALLRSKSSPSLENSGSGQWLHSSLALESIEPEQPMQPKQDFVSPTSHRLAPVVAIVLTGGLAIW